MKLDPNTIKRAKALAASYGRSALSAAVAVWVTGNHSPKDMGVAALSAVLPPLLRWLNSNDPAFGRGSNKE